MPAPERNRSDLPASDRSAAGREVRPDLSAVPSFLRDAERRSTTSPRSGPPASPSALAMPRPTTPTAAHAPSAPPPLDPAALPMPSLSRRRVVTAAGAIVAGLLVLTFARQVGEATAASEKAAALRAGNAVLRDQVARLEQDLGHVQDPRFIQLAGRAYGLGGPKEVPFALAAGAPPLGPHAPGSAAVRLGAEATAATPLDAWLELLFGAGP
jgi:hypothetical protein